jgi:protein-tyrosine phosphatase
MAGSRYVLVEFQKDTDWTLGRQVITHLIQGGYRPILAHPELAPQVQADYTRAAALKSEGVRLQVIAPSLRGLLGSKPLELAKQLLRDGLADLLATDAHRPELRLPQLTPAQAVVTGIAGADKFRSLTVTEALKILQDEP